MPTPPLLASSPSLSTPQIATSVVGSSVHVTLGGRFVDLTMSMWKSLDVDYERDTARSEYQRQGQPLKGRDRWRYAPPSGRTTRCGLRRGGQSAGCCSDVLPTLFLSLNHSIQLLRSETDNPNLTDTAHHRTLFRLHHADEDFINTMSQRFVQSEQSSQDATYLMFTVSRSWLPHPILLDPLAIGAAQA